jgi:hypothetical protein
MQDSHRPQPLSVRAVQRWHCIGRLALDQLHFLPEVDSNPEVDSHPEAHSQLGDPEGSRVELSHNSAAAGTL